MSCLGYIVSDSKIKNLKGFVEQVSDVSLADLTKPTLFVGVENARKNIEGFSILKKKYGDNIFWTYKKTEKRVDFEDDINYFYNNIIYNISCNIKYYYINILKLKYNKIKKLYNIIFSSEKKYIYISNNMIYLLHNEKDVFGISISILEFLNIDVKKIFKKLYSNENNIICTNMSNCVKSIKAEIGNKKYVVPYFMSIL
jgi:hypothetical protein